MPALARQVAERAQMILRGRALSHRDRVAVLESERGQPSHRVPRCELTRDVREHTSRIARERIGERVVQHREQSRARVLGVHIDGAGPERLHRDLRLPEPHPPVDDHPVRLEQLREHLGEQIRLAERLRCHDDRRRCGMRRLERAATCARTFPASATAAIASSARFTRAPAAAPTPRARARAALRRTALPVTIARPVDRSLLLDASRTHDHQLVRQTRGFGQIVRHHQHRERELVPQRIECRLQIRACDRIERAERLVHEHHTGPRRERARERHALPLPSRELVRKSLAKSLRGKPDQRQRVGGHGARIRDAEQRGHERDVSQDAPVRHQAAVLRHVADHSAQLHTRTIAHARSANGDHSARGLDQAIEAPEQRRLSRPALANQRDALPRSDVETHAIERQHVAIAPDHIARGKRQRLASGRSV